MVIQRQVLHNCLDKAKHFITLGEQINPETIVIWE